MKSFLQISENSFLIKRGTYYIINKLFKSICMNIKTIPLRYRVVQLNGITYISSPFIVV